MPDDAIRRGAANAVHVCMGVERADRVIVVTDRARARAVRPAEVAEVADRPPVERDHSEAVVNTMVVLDALDRVSPEHREVLVQLYYRGRSVTEAAKELGVPPGTVKSRSYYALRALRTVMGPEAEVAR